MNHETLLNFELWTDAGMNSELICEIWVSDDKTAQDMATKLGIIAFYQGQAILVPDESYLK